MKRLSIILPVYNVEPYIERCLRSLEDQDIPKDDYEIICINDGSTDNGREVIKRLKNEYKNLILVDRDNKGVSCARNTGIDLAIGTYVLFIDPDDYVDANRFGRILEKAFAKEAQVLFLGYSKLNVDGFILKQIVYGNNSNQLYSGTKAYFLTQGDGYLDPERIWAVLFSRDFLNENNLRFLPDVPYGEDAEFIARILCLANRCIFDEHSFYHNTTRIGSVMNSNIFNSDKVTQGFLLLANNLNNFQQMNSLSDSQREFLNHPICKFVIMTITSAKKPFKLKRLCNARKKLIESGLKRVKLVSVYKPLTLQGYFYNRSILHLLIYQFLIDGLHSINLRLKRIICFPLH